MLVRNSRSQEILLTSIIREDDVTRGGFTQKNRKETTEKLTDGLRRQLGGNRNMSE